MVCFIASLAVWTAAFAAEAPQRAPDARPYMAFGAAASDTLRYTARAGQPFIVALPARVGGAEATYRPLEAPALSWLVDRSFYWNVQPGESGTLPVVFERRTPGGGADTLVLLVDLTQ